MEENKEKSDTPKKDRAYWMSRPAEERMAELERLRQEKYGYDPLTAKVERVLEYCTLDDLK